VRSERQREVGSKGAKCAAHHPRVALLVLRLEHYPKAARLEQREFASGEMACCGNVLMLCAAAGRPTERLARHDWEAETHVLPRPVVAHVTVGERKHLGRA
jgi:hypothetical protein